MTAPAGWVPDRGEVIWINHNPQAGRDRLPQHQLDQVQAIVGQILGFLA